MVATVTRLLGGADIALAEEVVQDAMVAALQRWPFHGIPENPTWLVQVAKNRALDLLRRRALHDRRSAEIAHALIDELGVPSASGNPPLDTSSATISCA